MIQELGRDTSIGAAGGTGVRVVMGAGVTGPKGVTGSRSRGAAECMGTFQSFRVEVWELWELRELWEQWDLVEQQELEVQLGPREVLSDT